MNLIQKAFLFAEEEASMRRTVTAKRGLSYVSREGR